MAGIQRGEPVGRTTTIAERIRAAADALDDRLSVLGPLGSTAILTIMATTAAVTLHTLVRMLEGLPVQSIAAVNLTLEMAVITGPVIYYARDVIAQLQRSRSHLDIMSRRLAASVDQAESANKAKSSFLANMSHELRTPLNAIMGFSEIMKGEHLGPMHNDRYRNYAGDIHASGRYLLGIINDILDLSKIEAGKMTLENAAEFPLCQALEGTIGMVQPLGEKYGVAVSGVLPPADVRLMAVERMVHQVMLNLLGNAIKFTPAGGSVVVAGESLPCGGYRVSVSDTGIGMSADDMEKALTPFGQVANKMTSTHAGTGLGLPLAKAMMELHGGALMVESQPHHGTTIVLHFPAERVLRGNRAAA